MPRAEKHQARVARASTQERMAGFLRYVSDGHTVRDALNMAAIPEATYKAWRMRYADFRVQVDQAKTKPIVNPDLIHPELRDGYHKPGRRKSVFDFVVERKLYFGHDTPDFQAEIVDMLSTLRGGDVLMVLLPPEHGKTTLFEDFACLTLGHNPSFRFHVGSESQQLSKKILGRIRSRMSPPPGSYLWRYVRDLGPFAPQMGDTQIQAWTATHFDVRDKGTDERDYSMAALGFGSQIIGSRSEGLHNDDLQSRKTLSQTEELFEVWRQDWLSRPGETGWTTVFGNRVDNGDIYEAIEENLSSDVLRIVRYPPYRMVDGQTVPLWPDRWPLEKLERFRDSGKVSGETWDRNWMQNPRSRRFLTFREEDLDRLKVPGKTFMDQHPGRMAWVTLDPALGSKNAVMALLPSSESLEIVDIQEDEGLRSNEAIMGVVEDMILRLRSRGITVSDLIIEAKNFQAGLARDERLLKMRDAYGFDVREHLTGVNKYDENIGVPSMVHTVVNRQLVLPYGEDERTRFWIDELRRQMLAWKPYMKGTKLRQDILMALWFGWIRWRSLNKPDLDTIRSDWRHQGVPYAKTGSGLIVPTRYTPIFGRAS